MAFNRERIFLGICMLSLVSFFLLGHPVMMDDGSHYEGFAEALARGKIDFQSFYGFQGLSFFAAPVYLLTGSNISIIIASMIFSVLSIPLAYAVGREYWGSDSAGRIFVAIFFLTTFPMVTLMRGFQESALLFFILLILYGSFSKKSWTPLAHGIGAIVKPFSLVLAPLAWKKVFEKGNKIFLVLGILVLALYGGVNYYQTGHFVTLGATGSYTGAFDTENIPPLAKSFTISIKSILRVPANLFIASRKIMVSPLLIILGLWWVFRTKFLRFRKEIILSVLLNALLVGLLTFEFPKYLLPMTTLLSLMAIPVLEKYRWLIPLVIIDSYFVSLAIYRYHGNVFWDSKLVYYLPLMTAILIFTYDRHKRLHNNTD